MTLRGLISCVGLVVSLNCASSALAQAVKVPESNPMTPEPMLGYLPASAIPSSLSLALPPPAPDSAAMARDDEANRSALALANSPRWELAKSDAVLTFPAVAQTFACALNLAVDDQRAPKLTTLLRKTLVAAGRSTYEAKQHYRRARPFMVNGKPICTPDIEGALRRDGSYPSGHAAIGWAFGLVLAEVAPDRADAVLARGRAFGQSRLVCNLHWQSDVIEGQFAGAAVVARLHAEPAFLSDVAAAREEVAALRKQGLPLGRDCESETKTLKSW